MQGIFVDETTNIYSTDVKEYLDQIDDKVKMVDGIRGSRLASCRKLRPMFAS